MSSRKRWKSRVLGRYEITVAVIAAFAVISGAWISNINNLHSPSGASVSIVSPDGHRPVSALETVSGTVTNPELGKAVWVVVKSQSDGRYYPHKAAADMSSANEWKSSDTNIGAASDKGRKYDVIAVLADSTAQGMLRAYADDPASAGLDNLPPGIRQMDMVTVTRK